MSRVAFVNFGASSGVASSKARRSSRADPRQASVRHPMYRAFPIGTLGSVLMHPHAGQVFWAIMLVDTFQIFIPVEEAQLLRASGEAYRAYMQTTRWRLIRKFLSVNHGPAGHQQTMKM